MASLQFLAMFLAPLPLDPLHKRVAYFLAGASGVGGELFLRRQKKNGGSLFRAAEKCF